MPEYILPVHIAAHTQADPVVSHMHLTKGVCHCRIVQYATRHTSYYTTTHNQVLGKGLNWRLCHCPSKGGAVLAKVALLATVVTSVVNLHMWANATYMRAPIVETLNSTLLRRKAPHVGLS